MGIQKIQIAKHITTERLISKKSKLLILSGQFISLPWFLAHCNKNLEQWVERFKITDKLQLSSAQADRSFIRQTLLRHGSRLTPTSLTPPLVSPFYKFLSLGYALCIIGFVPTTSQWKGMQMDIHSKPIGNCKVCNSRLCCFYLPIIQSIVIIRCRIFVNP